MRGDVLEDEPYAGWAQELRRTYQGRVLGVRLGTADAALAELDYASALVHAQEAEALDAFDERARRSQMLALGAQLPERRDPQGRRTQPQRGRAIAIEKGWLREGP